MRVEDMADIRVASVGMLLAMPGPAMLRVDTLAFVLAVDVVISLRGPRAAMHALQAAQIIGIVAVAGEAVTGIRPLDILGSAITARAMAIHTSGLAITATAPVD